MSKLSKITYEEETIEIIYKKTTNKYTRVYVRDAKFEVRLAFSQDESVGYKLIVENIDTLHKQYLVNNLKNKRYDYNLDDNSTFTFLGKKLCVKIIDSSKNGCEIVSDVIYITRKNSNADVSKIVQKFLNSKSGEIFDDILNDALIEFNKYYELEKPELVVKKLKSRWGSWNNIDKKMVLNSRLIHYDYEIVRMVIFHELSHSIEQNHSKEFYKVLKLFVPNHSDLSKKLNYN